MNCSVIVIGSFYYRGSYRELGTAVEVVAGPDD